MALITIAVLSFAATSVFYAINNRNQTSANAASWQEALDVAESGVDVAMSALNASVKTPDTAWTGWTPSDASTFPKTYKGTLPTHIGEGNNKMYVSVTVDNSVKDSNGQTWFRVRSSGGTEVPGPKRVGYAPSLLTTTGKKYHSNFLRKIVYSAKNDASGGALHLPQTFRKVETMAQPVSARLFSKALIVQNSITMNGSSATDSFDSSSPAKSTNGQYDSSKAQAHGDVASNTSGNLSDLGNNVVNGNASSNAGVFQNTKNVKGTVYNNFSTTISPVAEPSFSYYTPGPSTISNLAAPLTLVAGTQAAPTNYKVAAINMGGNSKQLILAPPVPGQESYVNIWVTGDINMSGSGFIQQMPGVHATIYVDGNVTVTGSSFDNENGLAAYLTVNGVTPADGSARSFYVSGSGTFIGVVNAPAYALTIWGSGDFMGALIMLSANLGGSANYHYDEALGTVTGGNGLGYKVASWIEDIQ